MTRFTKASLITGIALLVYGYLVRILNIYFFWDSKTLGWIFLLLALTGHLFSVIRSKRMKGKKTMLAKLGAGFLVLLMVILPVVILLIRTSDAYMEATEYLKTNAGIKNEVGDVKGFGLITKGGVSTTSINGSESGNAEFNIIVRGAKKYKTLLFHW